MEYVKHINIVSRKGSFVVSVDPDTPDEILNAGWLVHTHGYPYRTETVGGRRTAIPLARAIMGLSPDDPRRVKFRNGNQLDCRKANLDVLGSNAFLQPLKLAEESSEPGPFVETPSQPDTMTEDEAAIEDVKVYPVLTKESLLLEAESYEDPEVKSFLARANVRTVSDKKLTVEMGYSTSPQLIRAKLIRFLSQVFGYSGLVECIIKPTIIKPVEVEKKDVEVKCARIPHEEEAQLQREEHTIRSLRNELEEAKRTINDLKSIELRSFHAESTEKKFVQTTIVQESNTRQVSLSDVPTEQLIRELKSRGAIRIVF